MNDSVKKSYEKHTENKLKAREEKEKDKQKANTNKHYYAATILGDGHGFCHMWD